MMMWFVMIACGPKAPDASKYDQDGQVEPVVDRPAGHIHDGVFTDETHGFRVPLLEGWVAEPGPSSGLMRVALRHVPTDTRVEFWVFQGGALAPRPREGCEWAFETEGRANAISDEVVVSVCTPNDPSNRRVFGTLFAHQGLVMQVEAHVANNALVEGKEAADRVIRQLRW